MNLRANIQNALRIANYVLLAKISILEKNGCCEAPEHWFGLAGY